MRESRGIRMMTGLKPRDLLVGMIIGCVLVLLLTGRNVPVFSAVLWNYQASLTGKPQMYQENGALWMLREPADNNRSGRDHSLGAVKQMDALVDKVRILVWVMTTPKNLETKAKAVKETWGKHCNVLIFFSSVADPSFPTISLNVADGRSHLTAKTMAAYRYLYDHHYNDADWFMKADDDTFVVAENLRYFLSDKNTSEPIHYGHLFRPNVKQGYYSGGGGYVVSKEALRRFGTEAVGSSEICWEDGKDEDVDWGECMEKLGVKTSLSTDKEGRTLFHPLDPTTYFLGKDLTQKFTWHYSAIKTWGYGVSPDAISFHYVDPDQMRLLYFFLYHWRVRGLEESQQQPYKTSIPKSATKKKLIPRLTQNVGIDSKKKDTV